MAVTTARTQTTGGSSVFNFLKLPNTPQLTALGSVNISNQSADIGLVFNNPALLRPAMHTQTNFVFNSLPAGIRNYHVLGGLYHDKLKTSFSVGINYFQYGSITETDISGNRLGAFYSSDYVLQVSASRQYLERWFYGATIKYMHSRYGQYRSSGVAMDLGISYQDSAAQLLVSFVAKNMGAQLNSYAGTAKDDLPFDLQIGISKRLSKAPFQFSFTARHLHEFDIRYQDTAFNNENGFDQAGKGGNFILDKLFRHVVLAVQGYIGDKVEITAGYNHLRRKELNIGNAGNGLNGFSLGAGALFKKLQVRYARSYYQRNLAFNQVGLNLKLNDYFGPGKSGNKAGR